MRRWSLPGGSLRGRVSSAQPLPGHVATAAGYPTRIPSPP